MTWSKEVTLWCDSDDCEEWERFNSQSVKGAVSMARKRDWTSPEWDTHYCPRCSN